MIKTISKTLFILFLILVFIVIYLSVYGVKTKKFNKEIINNISNINKNIDLYLSDVNYLLNPFELNINITTENPKIILASNKLEIKKIKTNISLKSLFANNLLINNLKISTNEIKINDLISLLRSFQNTPQLFILDNIIKDGTMAADIQLNFDSKNKIKKDYSIKGFIKKVKFNFLKQYEINNLEFAFDISSDKYLLSQIETELNNIKLTSSSINIQKKNDSFFIEGNFFNSSENLKIQDLKPVTGNFFDSTDIEKLKFTSKNNFSFNVNKKLKLDNIKLKTDIDLKQAVINAKNLELKDYLPNFTNKIILENHKIKINYNKDNLTIDGDGNIFLTNEPEKLSYKIKKNVQNLLFSTIVNIKNTSFNINFLNYKKKKKHKSTISINGNLKKNGTLKFESISLKEKKNKILFENLELDKNFKIVDVSHVDIDYKNDKNLLNKLSLKKKNSNFILEGEHFDATQLINNSISHDENKKSPIFHKFNTKIDIKIKKTYINDVDYINNLSGYLNFKNNKINNLKLSSIFPNNKKINLTINTNEVLEKETKLFTDYPKPFIKRYEFIKGFEDGYLNFNSVKKGNITNSILTISNFKIQEVPILAKLLSLASLQGIADILTGEGIRFTDLELKFSKQKNLTRIEEMYAIGPAVSILMDGYIENKKLISLRGTLVPATTINKSIASIPLLGKILVGDKTGEGIFGVSFKIKGPPKDLTTSVNPIKTLTPRFITRTLEKIKNN
jgi:hypothetical protein